MHELERRGAAGVTPAARPRSAAPASALLALQRNAGNAAVSRLVAGLSVQRIWPFDDEEDENGEPTAEDEAAGEEAAGEEAAGEAYNSTGGSTSGDYNRTSGSTLGTADWTASVGPGRLSVDGRPRNPEAAADRKVAAETQEWVRVHARNFPVEGIPPEVREGGSGRMTMARHYWSPFPEPEEISLDLVARQAMRHAFGSFSPDIDRIINQPPESTSGDYNRAGGSTLGTPGGLAGPGTGPAGGGSVPAGGSGSAPGGIPGLEPVSGGGASGPVAERPMLRVGSVSDAVRELQELLVRQGAAIEPDGAFGQLTMRAVIAFQRQVGLDADGIAGPLTWGALGAG
ncbi:MAG: peptidoglycan-binding protein [Chloroflexi bacterium]|nr:peptidoglycan-binding protein [Chloroflexota bacterium]